MQDSNAASKKKRWLEIAGFLAVTVVMLIIMSYVMDPVRLGMADKVYSRDRYIAAALAEPKDSIDVMIMGDSEALTLADTSKLEEAGRYLYLRPIW